MTIRGAVHDDFNEIVEIVNSSELGNKYFNNNLHKLKKIIEKDIRESKLIIATIDSGKCIGVMSFDLEGAFGKYPYIHFMVIKDDYQRQKIGCQMMTFFEKIIAGFYNKIFLMVGDWNKMAFEFYTHLNYQPLCEIDGFYNEQFKEILMVKG
ncbi:MAG: GCN5-related N-acetyltransferase [uncultured bacterium (gcode 4)]|uniref:GCN5-related N-acetyltransferase n=1 Tax=uncultured bacterium (gcode 4) TaxID=1234023 RepID=K2F7G5_9BACT|nr:MAG: GCN5-related N-acetyltransferase [uncultured bacterium (gcode 4)]